jgi:hypothetical protein
MNSRIYYILNHFDENGALTVTDFENRPTRFVQNTANKVILFGGLATLVICNIVFIIRREPG